MHDYSLSHVNDRDLLRQLAEHADRERAATAEVLAYVAEMKARGLAVPPELVAAVNEIAARTSPEEAPEDVL